MTLRLPGFIIAGAPRTATTWLYLLADRHPGIAMAKPMTPEPKFFLVDDLFARGLEHYSRTWFDPLPAGKLLGEKSTNYLESPAAAARIRQALPEVKLIFLLRNPIDRAYSNYLWSKRHGHETEDFERALELEEERDRSPAPALRYARPFAYVSRGLYADLLAPWFGRFDPGQILVLRTEDVAEDPQSVAVRFQRFLNVVELPELGEGLGIVNAAVPAGAPALNPKLRRRLAQRFHEPNERLRTLLREFTLWAD